MGKLQKHLLTDPPRVNLPEWPARARMADNGRETSPAKAHAYYS